MTFDPVARFADFVARRRLLNRRADVSALDIDHWLERHSRPPRSLAELADFQDLIETRKAHLTALITLDDELLNWIISQRQQPHIE